MTDTEKSIFEGRFREDKNQYIKVRSVATFGSGKPGGTFSVLPGLFTKLAKITEAISKETLRKVATPLEQNTRFYYFG